MTRWSARLQKSMQSTGRLRPNGRRRCVHHGARPLCSLSNQRQSPCPYIQRSHQQQHVQLPSIHM